MGENEQIIISYYFTVNVWGYPQVTILLLTSPMEHMGYTGCLIGILLMVYHNPHFTVQYFIPYMPFKTN